MEKEKILRNFGRIIAARRQQQDLSQEELSERANLDRTYISGLERGVRNPSFTALVKLGNGLGISVSEMLQGVVIHESKSNEGKK